MRMRKKKHGAERIAACAEYFLQNREEITNFPIEIEIGCGKGAFITQMARRFPDRNFVAIEKISDVILFAAEKLKEQKLENVKLMRANAQTLNEFFKAGDVKRIYLNFSDPWPKKGHYKRRLTYRGFLELYKTFLTADGEIILKTDNVSLFDFSLEEFEAAGFKLREISRDLHNSGYAEDNIMTEYEKNFSEKGFSINRVVAYL